MTNPKSPLHEKLWTGYNEIACCLTCGHSISLHHRNNMIEEPGFPYSSYFYSNDGIKMCTCREFKARTIKILDTGQRNTTEVERDHS
jgi:hypothetical protein